jgi:hypothetical protein
MTVLPSPAQDAGQLVDPLRVDPSAVAGLPVHHPGQLGRERIGQTVQADTTVRV